MFHEDKTDDDEMLHGYSGRRNDDPMGISQRRHLAMCTYDRVTL